MIVGGLFGLIVQHVADATPPTTFDISRDRLLVNASSGLAVALESLAPPVVWLPSYLCVSLVTATRHARREARFYPVDATLSLGSRAWFDDISPGDAVVVIDYFGFPAHADDVAQIRARGAIVIEDATQALLTEGAGTLGDYAIFSPRKFLGVPDGGILKSNRSEGLDCELFEPPAAWWLKALQAAVARSQCDAGSVAGDWFTLFREVEATAPIGRYRMSDLSRNLLAHGFDYAAMARQRAANYDRLARGLADVAVFPSRPPGVTPLAFPVRVRNRDRVRRALFRHDMFPPIHWDLDGVVPRCFEESHHLAAEIMSLPCDQRYAEAEMDRMTTALRDALVAER